MRAPQLSIPLLRDILLPSEGISRDEDPDSDTALLAANTSILDASAQLAAKAMTLFDQSDVTGRCL